MMTKVAVLGGGIAGLSAGWLLKQRGRDFCLLEKQACIGGLARSFEWYGYHCDIGAHRLFTNDSELLSQLIGIVPMEVHQRQSRIYLQGMWLNEPLDILELALNLPPSRLLKLLGEYLFRPRNAPEDSFESYVVRRYGSGLADLFFSPYTQKLFGLPGNEISAMWARQKVRLASPYDPYRDDTKRKFSSFYYPVQGGYGAIAQGLYREIIDKVLLESEIVGFEHDAGQIKAVKYRRQGQESVIPVAAVISTLPLDRVCSMLGSTHRLHYRLVSLVYLLVNRPMISGNQWIYFVDEDIAINRLVEFRNFTGAKPPGDRTVLCAEVTQVHDDMAGKVISDLVRVGLLNSIDVLDVRIIQEDYAYPVYDRLFENTYPNILNTLSGYENLFQAGRAAEFTHWEADDSYASAMKAVDRVTQSTTMTPAYADGKNKSGNHHPARVFAVVLTHNHYTDTYECLKSVLAMQHQDMQVVLVDNASTDSTPINIRQDFPQIHVIENPANLGVPAGYNVGFKYALETGAEYILMLNNDTVVSVDMLAELLAIAENDPKSAIVMPSVLFYGTEDRIWSNGGRYRKFPPAILMTDKRKTADPMARLIEYAPGCGLLIHRRAFEQVGLFDPEFFFLFDDWDFSKRVHQQGLNIWHAPRARMWHKVSITSQSLGSPIYWRTFGASSVRYYRKHGRPVWISLPIHLGYLILREFAWKMNWRYWPSFWAGFCEGLNSPLTFPSAAREVG